MPEAVAAVVAEAIGEDFVFSAALASAIQVASTVAAVYSLREDQRKALNNQRAAYNASLKDRYVMLRSATEARAVVLGRQRVSGPVIGPFSYGAHREHLVFGVILAAHECDAVEEIYFDDELVTLDGSGNVLAVNRRDLFTLSATGATFTLSSLPNAATVAASVAYGSTQVALGVSVAGSDVTVSGGTAGHTGTVTISYQPAQSPFVSSAVVDAQDTVALNDAGTGSVTLAHTPIAGSVHVVYSVAPGTDNQVMNDLAAYTGVAGAVVTVTGAPFPSVNATVSYQYQPALTSRARVRKYLGAPGQAVDAGMVAALPGIWDSTHTLTGLTWLAVELDYDADAFPSGLMNVSARVRGAKCFDPRDGATRWTENPALLARHVATHPLLGRLDATSIDDTAVAVAATACDALADYVVDGRTYTRAMYTAGLVVKSTTRAKDALDDLAKAMAGRWAFSGGLLKMRAGAYVTPLQSLDETWLADGQMPQVQTAANRGDLVNNVSGRFADETRDYVEVDFPRVISATYLAADGADLPLDVPLNAVTFSGQCQQVVAAQMRDVRMGLRLTVVCNMRAWRVEVFDTLYVSLARFGWVNKVFEVLDVAWTLDGGIQLSLKATDPSIWALGTGFSATALSANTLFPSPWQVPAVASLAAASGTGQLLKMADGSVLTRVAVTWAALTDGLVLADGGVEVRYGLASDPESQWQSVLAERGQALAYLTENIRDGWIYLIKARAYNALVKGTWSAPVLHQVVGKSAAPSSVASLAATGIPGGVQVTWTPNSDADYLETEVRYGSSWAAGTQIFRGAAAGFVWPWPAAGSYTVRVKHRDTSRNESSEATASITVGSSSLINTGQLGTTAATETWSAYDATGVGYSSAV